METSTIAHISMICLYLSEQFPCELLPLTELLLIPQGWLRIMLFPQAYVTIHWVFLILVKGPSVQKTTNTSWILSFSWDLRSPGVKRAIEPPASETALGPRPRRDSRLMGPQWVCSCGMKEVISTWHSIVGSRLLLSLEDVPCFSDFFIGHIPETEQRTCDFFPVIYVPVVAPSQDAGLSNDICYFIDWNGQTILFWINKWFVEGWFMTVEIANLYGKELRIICESWAYSKMRFNRGKGPVVLL